MKDICEPQALPTPPDLMRLDIDRDVAPGVLGRKALLLGQERENLRRMGKGYLYDYPHEDPVHNELEQVRNIIDKLDKHEAARFNAHTTYLIAAENGWDGQVDDAPQVFNWKSWLNLPATDDEVLDFLAWNAGRLVAKQRGRAFQEAVEQAKQECIQGTKRGLSMNVLDPMVEESLGKIATTKVMIGDFFDMYVSHRRGYTYNQSDTAYVEEPAAQDGSVTPDLRRIMRHEICHARIGSLENLFSDEVFTEQFAHAAQDGRWFRLRPNAHDLPGSYINCRLLGSLVWPKRSDIQDQLRAYSSAEDRATSERHLHAIRRRRGYDYIRTQERIDRAMTLAVVIAEEQGGSAGEAIERASGLLITGGRSPRLRPELVVRDRAGFRGLVNLITKSLEIDGNCLPIAQATGLSKA